MHGFRRPASPALEQRTRVPHGALPGKGGNAPGEMADHVWGAARRTAARAGWRTKDPGRFAHGSRMHRLIARIGVGGSRRSARPTIRASLRLRRWIAPDASLIAAIRSGRSRRSVRASIRASSERRSIIAPDASSRRPHRRRSIGEIRASEHPRVQRAPRHHRSGCISSSPPSDSVDQGDRCPDTSVRSASITATCAPTAASPPPHRGRSIDPIHADRHRRIRRAPRPTEPPSPPTNAVLDLARRGWVLFQKKSEASISTRAPTAPTTRSRTGAIHPCEEIRPDHASHARASTCAKGWRAAAHHPFDRRPPQPHRVSSVSPPPRRG